MYIYIYIYEITYSLLILILKGIKLLSFNYTTLSVKLIIINYIGRTFKCVNIITSFTVSNLLIMC